MGDRIDHVLANVFFLIELQRDVKVVIVDGQKECYFVRNSLRLKGKKGDEVSLIPLKHGSHGITTQGLYYPLQNETLPFGSTRGISNIFKKKEIKISLQSGLLLVIHNKCSVDLP